MFNLFRKSDKPFHPHDYFTISPEITNRRQDFDPSHKRLGLTHDPRVRTIPSNASMQEKFQALTDLRKEVDRKLYL